MKGLYRPEHVRLKHGKGIWSGPFFPGLEAARELNRRYADLRKQQGVRLLSKLCEKVHGFSNAEPREITSDGYVNALAVWIVLDDHGAMGVLFPDADDHGRVTREISFYVKGAGQVDVDNIAHYLSSIFATAVK